MLVDTDKMIPITKLQKELTQTVRELAETGEPVYILKNNNMEAVLVPFDEYRYLTDLEEMFDYFEVQETISTRMKRYDSNKNIPWAKLKDE